MRRTNYAVAEQSKAEMFRESEQEKCEPKKRKEEDPFVNLMKSKLPIQFHLLM